MGVHMVGGAAWVLGLGARHASPHILMHAAVGVVRVFAALDDPAVCAGRGVPYPGGCHGSACSATWAGRHAGLAGWMPMRQHPWGCWHMGLWCVVYYPIHSFPFLSYPIMTYPVQHTCGVAAQARAAAAMRAVGGCAAMSPRATHVAHLQAICMQGS